MALLLGAQSGFGARTTRFQDHHFLSGGKNIPSMSTNVVVSWVTVQQGVTFWVFVSKDSQPKQKICSTMVDYCIIFHLSSVWPWKDVSRSYQLFFSKNKDQESRLQTPYTNVSLLITFFLYKATRFIRSLVVYPKIYDGKLYVLVIVGFLRGQQYQPTKISSCQIQWVFVTASWNVSICWTFCVTITCTCSDL